MVEALQPFKLQLEDILARHFNPSIQVPHHTNRNLDHNRDNCRENFQDNLAKARLSSRLGIRRHRDTDLNPLVFHLFNPALREHLPSNSQVFLALQDILSRDIRARRTTLKRRAILTSNNLNNLLVILHHSNLNNLLATLHHSHLRDPASLIKLP